MVNHKPVERIYPDDTRVKPQTVAHHKARYKFACETFRKDGESALDLACGTGYGTEMLRKAGYKTKGVDIDKDAIDFAKSNYPKNNFELNSLQNVVFNYYDMITLFEALEHLNYGDGVTLLESIQKSLNPHGIFIMSVPRDTNPKYNKFHLSRWDYQLLNEVLGHIFGAVEILGQDWDTAKISPDSPWLNDFFIVVCKK